MEEKSAAVLTIHDASHMTPEGKQLIAKWLRRQAKFLVEDGKQFASIFRARYLYRDDEAEEQ